MDLKHFHPSDIQLNYTLPGSDDYYVLTFEMLDQETKSIVNYAVVHGCTITACFSFFILLLLIIKNKKTPIFILNQVILVVAMIRSSLFLAYQLGPLGSLEVAFIAFVDYRYRSAYKISVATNAILIILVFLIQLSFTYQTWIIFKSPEVKKYRNWLMALFAGLTAVTFGFYVNDAIISTQTFKAAAYNELTAIPKVWARFVPLILFCASINLMSIILILKLIFAIRTRRYLGLKQFSYHHIMLIMFSSTLIFPTILTISTYAVSETYIYSDILPHISLSLTALLLPFTTLWAAIANNSRNLSSSALVYLTSSNNSSGYSSNASPIDEKTFNSTDDSFSFFPEKLNQLKTAQSIDSNHSSPTVRDEDHNMPVDILELIQNDNESLDPKKHVNTLSHDSFDKLEGDIVIKAIYNQDI